MNNPKLTLSASAMQLRTHKTIEYLNIYRRKILKLEISNSICVVYLVKYPMYFVCDRRSLASYSSAFRVRQLHKYSVFVFVAKVREENVQDGKIF